MGWQIVENTIRTVTQISLDNFRNVVDSEMQKSLRSCSRKLYSALSLTVDEVEQYIHYNPGYANATGYSTRPKSCD